MKRIFLVIFCLVFSSILAQTGPRSWQDHLSLNNSNTITRFNNKIYASNYNGIVKIDESDFSSEKLNKINGLHDVGIRLLRTNPNNNKLLVVYDNSNIDVINSDEEVKNYSEIKSKVLSGKKIINEVTFKDKYAYLASGIGIIVFDTEKLEVKETYIIGPNGSNLEVYQVALNDSLIFAATPNGLYRANYKTKILNNYSNWVLVPSSSIPSGAVGNVLSVGDKIVASRSPSKLSQDSLLKDKLYVLTNNIWTQMYSSPPPTNVRKLTHAYGTYFSMIDQNGVAIIDVNTLSLKAYITQIVGATQYRPNDAYFDIYNGSYTYWIADQFNGAIQAVSSFTFDPQNIIKSFGTNTNLVSNIDIFDGKIAVSPSSPDQAGGSIVTTEGINIFKDNEWSYIVSQNPNAHNPGAIVDINSVYFDRKDKTKFYAGSWFAGLMEFKDNQLIAVYDHTNTPVIPEVYSKAARVSGMCMDKDGNLWFASSDSKNFINVKKTNGTFQTFYFDAGRFTRKLFIDKNNYLWALHERQGGITVFNHSNFSTPAQNVNYKVLTKDVGSGNLESNSVYAIAEDKDGKIWIGTGAGIRVIYNPTSIFSGGNYDAQPIKIVQDGNVELLLEKDVVTCIVVDGANNKWVGTQDGGLYCFSPDGLTQLYHFTKDNSPLYSNTIIDINYEKITGDIYIGTLLGVQSFRSIVIEGDEKYENVYAYPNPVKPNYTGTVLVRGLIDNSIVKIVDQAGNLVWETKSQGGQIEWPLKNLSGGRVASGAYVVYASTATADQKAVSKILVIN